MSNININHLNSIASIHNKIKDVMKSIMQNQAELFFRSRSFIIIWDCCCCIEVNICWKLCICSCCCLVCSSKIFIISWCCFLDWSSRLPSTSTRCFGSCNSSSFHTEQEHFFSRKYAIVSLPLLRLFFALGSHSPPLHLAAFYVFCPNSLELCFSFPLLLRCQLSSCRFARCLQLQLIFRLLLPEPFPPHSNHIRFHLPSLHLSSLL